MQIRDYPLKPTGLVIPSNVKVIVRERGKIVRQHCREDHNIWVDVGREFLARVIAPNTGLTDHYAETGPGDREFVKYMGAGIGGLSQVHPAAYTTPLSTDYPPATGTAPGSDGNQYSDEDLTVLTLERPVKINTTSPIWLGEVVTPVTFLNSGRTLRVDYLFTAASINNVGPYTVVPLSEIALFMSTADADATNVYDTGNTPSMVGAGRQSILAYNTMEPIPKTIDFSLETQWELRF